MEFEILENWEELLDKFPPEKKDIYFSRKYIGLYEAEESRARCAVAKEDGKIMLMPFIAGEKDGFYDFETAYGYGGPIANTDDLIWCYDAFDGIYDYLKDQSYLCGFTRFHPLLQNEKYIRPSEKNSDRFIKTIYDRQTIAFDTTQSPDDIWTKQINSKNRNMIRKAEKNDLQYASEYDFASYNEFIALYRETMKRLSADEFYFFDDSYFDKLRVSLKENAFLGTVRKDGKLICAAIFMFSECYGHYHLEGSDRNYSSLGANNFLLWKAACEMHEKGIREFHLGGGTSSSPDDPLYKFKKAFSNNEKRFFIGKEIFLMEKYNEIVTSWEKENPEKNEMYGNRLLKYRY